MVFEIAVAAMHNGGVDEMVAGVDGCRAGWMVVRARARLGRLTLLDTSVVPCFDDVLALTGDCAAVAVDMPIGLADDAPRLCDALARRVLGRPGSSSVFPAPVRASLACNDYVAACEASFSASGRRLSRQTFNILPRICEVDAAMTPALQSRVFEVHPELAFRALGEGVVLARKRDIDGGAQRAELLSRIYAIDFAVLPLLRGARRDDLYDAAVCAWSAVRLLEGTARRLPESPAHDSRGLRMEICY